MEVQLPDKVRFDRIEAKLDALLARIQELENRQLSEWVSLKEACRHTGIALGTAQNHRWMQPPENARREVGGSRGWKWPREVILEWTRKTDAELRAEWEGDRFKIHRPA
jgi:hypothetical protein